MFVILRCHKSDAQPSWLPPREPTTQPRNIAVTDSPVGPPILTPSQRGPHAKILLIHAEKPITRKPNFQLILPTMKSNENSNVLFPFSTPLGDLNTPDSNALAQPQSIFSDYACDPQAQSRERGDKAQRQEFSFR